MIEPLADELAQLIAAERIAPVTDAVAQAAVRAKLAIAIGHAPFGVAAIGVKVLAIFAVVVGAGVGTKLLLDRETSVAPAPRANLTPVAASPSAPRMDGPRSAQPSAKPTSEPPPRARAVSAEARAAARSVPAIASAEAPMTIEPTPDPSPPSEAELLRQAWATRDAALALELVHRDAALHPAGALAEERIALEVRALADLHHPNEARATAAQFFISYPNTVHRELVNRALARKDPP